MSSEFVPDATTKVEVIPQDLKDLWGSIEACATTANVIDEGTYKHQWAGAVRAARTFVIKLHEQQVELALKHPQAHMIPELKEIRDGQAKAEAKN